jgi:hypothetical protein
MNRVRKTTFNACSFLIRHFAIIELNTFFMPTDDHMVINKLTEELNEEWEKYRLALKSDEIFEVRKKIRMKIREIAEQIRTLNNPDSA